MKKVILVVCFLLLFTNCSSSCSEKPDFSTSKSSESLSYTLHDPIAIDGNESFVNMANNENWDGYGNSTHPFIIENIEINHGGSGCCVDIQNTDVYFIIRNCYFYNVLSGDGIVFENVTNGVITNNLLDDINSQSILIWKSRSIICEGNEVWGPNIYGISVSKSNDTIIRNNQILGTHDQGFTLSITRNITVFNNTATAGNSDPSVMCYGIDVHYSSLANISNNYFELFISGMRVYYSSNNIIHNNTFVNCKDRPLWLGTEAGKDGPNVFTWNEFKSGDSAKSIISEEEENATFDYNYYYDYHLQGGDANQDGISDTPFEFEGFVDEHPVMMPFHNNPCWLVFSSEIDHEFGEGFFYDFDATANVPGIDSWWVTNENFSINPLGVLTNTNTLPVGQQTLTIFVNDTYGWYSELEVTVNTQDTLAPVLTSTPVNQILEFNESLEYQFHVSDASEINLWSVNNTQFVISETGILSNSTVLNPGLYCLTVSVEDIYENKLDIEFNVTVEEAPTTSTTTTTSETSTNSDTTTEDSSLTISDTSDALQTLSVIIIVGSIGVIIVFVILIYRSKEI